MIQVIEQFIVYYFLVYKQTKNRGWANLFLRVAIRPIWSEFMKKKEREKREKRS